ncbi:hypothetical protein [Flavobacterium sp. C4GT6]|uniref:hypothetical protein n=1 Tax=Flavobacterium sp. C4GT6 TaxID=3103818 RepID=UPI002ED32A75
MKLFISWSGEASKQIASELRTWIPTVLQAVIPFYTPDDIDKGSAWLSDILKHLHECKFGIICITPENMEKPWILFEAGALASKLDKARVATIVFGTEKSNIKSPLNIFQTTEFEKEDMFKLLKSINSQLENKVDETNLRTVFDALYPNLEEKIKMIIDRHISEDQRQLVKRNTEEILDEILINTRNILQGQTRNEMYRDQIKKLIPMQFNKRNSFNDRYVLHQILNELRSENNIDKDSVNTDDVNHG